MKDIPNFFASKGWSHQQVGASKIYCSPNNAMSFEFIGGYVYLYGWYGNGWLLVDNFPKPDTLQGLKERVLKAMA